MRTLYHFQHSPFARRVRLALAHKGLDCELREARENPAFLAEARGLVPTRTIPVLVDGDRVLGDSTAIAHWLDQAYPARPRLWPEGDEALDALTTAALVDAALNLVVDLGARYFSLRESASWTGVKDEMLGRARQILEALAARAQSLGRATVAPSGWSAADIWLFTLVAWLEGIPGRVKSSPNAAQIATLGLTVPDALSKWADAHRGREAVRAMG